MAIQQRFMHRADRWQRRRAPVAFGLAVVKRFGEDGAGRLAALVAYYGFFSLFPLLLVFTSVLGFVLADRPDLRESVLDSALSQFPIIGSQIRRNIGAISGSALALGVGIAGALWAGIGGVRAAQVAMDAVWDVPHRERPGTPKAILRALVMLATLGVFVVMTTVLGSLAGGADASAIARIGATLGAALLNIALFLVAFRVLTVAPVGWRDVAPGAVLAGVVWTLLLLLGGWIVQNRLRSATEMYGFFAIVIGLLAWLYLGAQVMLVAAEVNVVRARRLWPRALDPADMTEADRRSLRGMAMVEERREEETVSVGFDGSDATNGVGAGDPPADPDPGRRPIGEVVRSVIDGVQSLLRSQIELAKLELMDAVSARARGIALLAVAGVFGLFALGYLSATAVAGLDNVLPAWASRLIVAGVFILAAVAAALAGKGAIRDAPTVPERTQETLKEDTEWAKRQIRR